MSSDAYFSGTFGVLATLLGVAAAYFLSLSQERRKDKAKYLSTLIALKREIARVFDSQQAKNFPTLRGMEVLLGRLDLKALSPELAAKLYNFLTLCERINQATIEHKNLISGLLASGALSNLGNYGTPLGISTDDYIKDRENLLLEQADQITTIRLALELELNSKY